MAELESAAVDLGYRRIHLTTGPRQPEARNLYLAAGYTPRFDPNADPETIGPLAFAKELAAGRRFCRMGAADLGGHRGRPSPAGPGRRTRGRRGGEPQRQRRPDSRLVRQNRFALATGAVDERRHLHSRLVNGAPR